MAGASKFGGTENGADCSKCGGTVAVLFKTRNGTSLLLTIKVKTCEPFLCFQKAEPEWKVLGSGLARVIAATPHSCDVERLTFSHN